MTNKSTGQLPESPATADKAADEHDAPGGGVSFPIVGVGASAGGLEAFTELLKHLPLDTGMGFVLVQHLDPQHESALTHLLSRATSLPVREVTNNLRVEANHVYDIPPNKNLGLAQERFEASAARADAHAASFHCFFFESLAQDQRERGFFSARQPTARSDWKRSKPRAGSRSRRMNRPATTRCRAAPRRRAAWISCSRRRTLRKNQRGLPNTPTSRVASKKSL